MNSLTIAGTLGRDAELKHLSNGDAICSFSIADSQAKDKPPIWWNCAMYGKRAESLHPYLKKGQNVTGIGSISEVDGIDKNGIARKYMNVRINDITLQGGKPATVDVSQQQNKQTTQGDGFDVPF